MAATPAFAATPNNGWATVGGTGWGGATVGSISGSGPWTATLTGMTTVSGLVVGQEIGATAGTGTLGGGAFIATVASIVSATSITITVTGGTTPTAGTVTTIVSGYNATMTRTPYDTSGSNPVVIATGAATGSLVSEITAHAPITSSAGKVTVWLSLNGGTNWKAIKEITMASGTVSGTSAGTDNNLVFVNLRLASAQHKVAVTSSISTSVVNVFALASDF